MNRKKLKITLEVEGEAPKVIEANGIAACVLGDGNSDDTHGIQIVICGHMGVKDLLHLHDGVGDDLIKALESSVIENVPASDLIRMLIGGSKNES